ncbi:MULTISPECIES: DUF547 domain-containing protein [unclassified Lacinutrix]
MKYFSIILFAILISSCSSTKQVIPNNEVKKEEISAIETEDVSPKTDAEVVIEKEIPEPPQAPKIEVVDAIDDYAPEAFNHHSWHTLLQKNVTESGNVNYLDFKNNPTALRAYIDSLAANMPTENWNSQDKLAYWINAYNALTVDLIIRNYPVKSIKDIKDPWDQRLWKLGEKWYNLNEIEHEILRKMNEPRIHFAIVCASFSCPKLQNEAFTASKLEEQLTNATKAFLGDSNRNEIASDKIKISKIFQWFSKDFKQDGDLIDFLNTYSEVDISSNAKKSYKDYNWDLNE